MKRYLVAFLKRKRFCQPEMGYRGLSRILALEDYLNWKKRLKVIWRYSLLEKNCYVPKKRRDWITSGDKNTKYFVRK